MAKKNQALRKIDQKTTTTGAPLPLIQEDQPAPPAFYLIPAPDTLIEVGQAVQRSTQAPLIAVAISWQEAPNIAPDYYNVEWSEDSGFAEVQRRRANTTSATIEGLKPDTTYYFRVQAVLGGIFSPFSETLEVLTMEDLTEPPVVTGLTATFITGDLFISWTKPISEIYKDAVVKIYNAAHSILYATLITANEQIIWTAEQNLAASGNVGVTSVSVDVMSRSWFNVEGDIVNTTATSAVPSMPSPTFNWTSDVGLADEDLLIQWSRQSDASSYDLSLDGVSFQTHDVSFRYAYDRNVKDHVPTLASGSPNIAYILRARNKLNQQSTAASGVINNVAPPSGVMSLTTVAGFSQITATVALLSSTIIQDFDHFEWSLTSGSTQVSSFISQDTTVHFTLSGSGIYSIGVKAVDKFNQKSVSTIASGIVMDVLTIEQLRAETRYLDSLGAQSPTLDFYKDAIGSTGTSKVYTAVASGVYQWIEAERPLLDRHKVVTFDATYGGITLAYLEFWDGSTTTYYSGPVTTGSIGQKILTKYTSLTTAKANAFRADLLGTTRIDLPNLQEGRKIRINFSNYGGSLTVYEYYPRRLVQTDDLEAENARAITAVVGTLAADKLSALVAYIGQLNIDTTGWLYQGTGTGNSPTTGLKIFNSGGIGKLSTYNSGVEQVTLDTDGKLKAGAGAVRLDEDGATIVGTSFTFPLGSLSAIPIPNIDNSLKWTKSSGGQQAAIAGSLSSQLLLLGDRITLAAPISTTYNVGIDINSTGTVSINTDNFSIGSFPFNHVTFEPDIGSNSGVATFNGEVDIDGTNNTSIFNDGTTETTYIRGGKTTSSVVINDLGADTLIRHSSGNTISLSSTGSTVTTRITVGDAATGNRFSHIDLIGDATYTDFGLRLIRNNAGANTASDIQHHGTGPLRLYTHEAAPISFITNNTARGRVGTNGNFAIGFDSDPSNIRLVTRGTDSTSSNYAFAAQNSGSTNLIRARNDGALNETIVAWTVTSDVDSKENIESINYGLDEVLKLRPVQFDFKNGAKDQFGFVAQEVQKIMPELIREKSDGMLGMQYDNLIPILVRAIQHLEQRLSKYE